MSTPRIAARAFIKKNNEILLSYFKDNLREWYLVPGGGQQKGETLKECLHREIKEELNADIEIGKLMFIREIIAERHPETFLPKDFHQVEVYFECTLISEPSNEALRKDKHQIDFKWVQVSDLPQLNFFPRGIRERLSLNKEIASYIGDMF